MKKIVGLVGELGAGKTTVAEYLVKKGFRHFRFSLPIEEEIKKRGLPFQRKIYQDVGDEWRERFGLDYISNLLLQKIAKDGGRFVLVDGFRNPGELKPFRKHRDFFLIALLADPRVRFERLKNRGLPHDPESWEDFQDQESRDRGENQPKFGQNTLEVIELADVQLNTDNDVSKVFEDVETILRERGVF